MNLFVSSISHFVEFGRIERGLIEKEMGSCPWLSLVFCDSIIVIILPVLFFSLAEMKLY